MPSKEMLSAFRMRTAMLKALNTSCVLIVVSIAHPKILLLPRSMNVAKNDGPVGVGK